MPLVFSPTIKDLLLFPPDVRSSSTASYRPFHFLFSPLLSAPLYPPNPSSLIRLLMVPFCISL